MEVIKILVAGDNYLFRKGMECLIEEEADFELAGMAGSEGELMGLLRGAGADVVAIDFSTVKFSGELMGGIKREGGEVRVLGFNVMQERGVVSEALMSGVTSYLLLCCDRGEIREAMMKTARGERFLCGKVVEVLIGGKNAGADEGCPLYGVCGGVNISEREMEVIRSISEGLSNQEIAERLFLSVHTVNTHRKNIMSKLGINNTAGLVMYAVRNQLVRTD